MTTDTLPDQAWLDRYNSHLTTWDRLDLEDVQHAVRVLREEHVEQRIEKSIALLAEHGHDVVAEIDLSVLEMDDCHRCVVGQIFGEYALGLHGLGVSFHRSVWKEGYAFDIGPTSLDEEVAYAALTALWEDKLLQLAQECG